MSVLSGPEIRRQIGLGTIIIDPLPVRFGPNSVDLAIQPVLLVYDEIKLSTRKKPRTREIIIPEEGYELRPGIGYLACTVERVAAQGFMPIVSGRSSVGRLFVEVEQTAGWADDGWDGCLTLELMANYLPVVIYPYDRLAQVKFDVVVGERNPYRGAYQNDTGPTVSKGLVRE